MPTVNLYQGNCLDELKKLPDNSIDAVVTDPPYGLGKEPDPVEVMKAWVEDKEHENNGKGFMGASWDSFVPQPAIWKEVYRVLKPGGHVVAFFGCYDRQTEVLTDSGWKFFTDVKNEDMFATLNPKTEEIEYQQPKELICVAGHKKMHKFKTNKIDLLITPNHNLLIKSWGQKKNQGEWRLVRADNTPAAMKMKKNGKWLGGTEKDFFCLPSYKTNVGHGHFKEVPAIKIPMDAWLKFLGLYLAEGSATKTKVKTGYGYNVQLCHFNNDTLDELEKELSPFFNICRYPKFGKFRINNQGLYELLKPLGKAWEKYVPDYVKALSARQLRIIWEWYLRGDGSKLGGRSRTYGYTTSKTMVDDWQEIALKMGISADYSLCKPKKEKSFIKGREICSRRQCYLITFNEAQNEPEVVNNETRCKSDKIIINQVIDFDDDVFCVEVPKYHTLYVRRNGKTVWCGNTRTYDWGVMAMRFAGFEIRDRIQWVFDNSEQREAFLASLTEEQRRELGGLLKGGDNEVFWAYGQGFPKSLSVGKAIDKLQGNERKVVGTDRAGKNALGQDSGWNAHANKTEFDVTKGDSDWEGWHTSLKPANEPIVLARKPLEKSLTIAENVLKHGTGAINVDGCRVLTDDDLNGGAYRGERTKDESDWGGTIHQNVGKEYVAPQGRFPANLIHSGEKAVVELFPETHGAGNVKESLCQTRDDTQRVYAGEWNSLLHNPNYHGNKGGSAARFFYCAKASKRDRNEGCEGLEEYILDETCPEDVKKEIEILLTSML